MQLVRPAPTQLPAYMAALRSGWSPNNTRPEAAQEELAPKAFLPLARAQGLSFIELTTDPDNLASQRVITRNGGVLVEAFDKGATYGHQPGLRYRITL